MIWTAPVTRDTLPTAAPDSIEVGRHLFRDLAVFNGTILRCGCVQDQFVRLLIPHSLAGAAGRAITRDGGRLKNKQPFAFDLLNGRMMAFAGLWDGWKDPANGVWLQSYTIITTGANELMAPIHDRMPVILHPSDYDRRLDQCFGPWG